MCLSISSPATSRVGNGGRPSPAVHTRKIGCRGIANRSRAPAAPADNQGRSAPPAPAATGPSDDRPGALPPATASHKSPKTESQIAGNPRANPPSLASPITSQGSIGPPPQPLTRSSRVTKSAQITRAGRSDRTLLSKLCQDHHLAHQFDATARLVRFRTNPGSQADLDLSAAINHCIVIRRT